eukprot:TRINITY_DN17958_c0_g1_i1.p1 TRINITY_DN17958_c0_g1~~TRINITY_DN17958_c0_g1_i1.p1  ORF type:complete len:361 (-),score=26.90 TRINITY_DN17958_c0_g1_i1:168-1250(-)
MSATEDQVIVKAIMANGDTIEVVGTLGLSVRALKELILEALGESADLCSRSRLVLLHEQVCVENHVTLAALNSELLCRPAATALEFNAVLKRGYRISRHWFPTTSSPDFHPDGSIIVPMWDRWKTYSLPSAESDAEASPQELRSLDPPSDVGYISNARGVACFSDGSICVVIRCRTMLMKLSAAGELVAISGAPMGNKAAGLNNVAVIEASQQVVAVAVDGNRVFIFNKDLEQEHEFPVADGPADVTILPSGEIAVAMLRAHEVRVFDTAGNLLRAFGQGCLLQPFGIASDHEGRVLVVDQISAKVHVFDDTTGEMLQGVDLPFDLPLSGERERLNKGIACSKDGEVVVTVCDKRMHTEY